MGNAQLCAAVELPTVQRMCGGFSWLEATIMLAYTAAAHPSNGRLFGSSTCGDPQQVV
jgi:hypothetical protein